MSLRWRSAPRGGSPRSSWPPSRWRDETTSQTSSPGSRATTATSSITWSRRSCSGYPTRSMVRAGAAGFLGIALWTGGDLAVAHRAWSECVAGLGRAGHVADALGATLALGDICIVQGRLSDAQRTYEHALA